MIGEVGRTSFKRVLNKGEAEPETVSRMLFSSKKSDVETLFKSLTPAGRQKARAAIIWKSMHDDGSDIAFSPERFLSKINKMGKQTGVFFAGTDRKAIKGLARVLAITKRASEASLSPPTGVQSAQTAATAALFGTGGAVGGIPGLAVAGGVGGAAGLTARAYESAAVRNLLVGISKSKSGSAEEAKLLKRIISSIQTANESETTDEH